MNTDVLVAWIAAGASLLVAIFGSIISYISALRRQEREIQSLEAR